MTPWNYADSQQYLDHVRQGLPPVMICVAVNGGVQGKEYNPALPESPEEIAASVEHAYRAGAAMVHVHARDPANPTLGARTAEAWRIVNGLIRARCPDIIINNTTGGDLLMTMEERLSSLDANPEIASLNLTPDMSRFTLKTRPAPLPSPRPETVIDACIPFTYGLIRRFALEMQRRGIKPELETYHTGGAWVIRDLISEGLVTAPFLIQTVMGAQTASYPTPEHLLHLLRDLPPDTVWLCSGIGVHQLPMVTMALLMGGQVRVGLEDNVYRRRGELLAGNAAAVEHVAELAHHLNRAVATPAQARAMLSLGVPTTYR